MGQYIYLHCPPITTSAAGRLASESYTKRSPWGRTAYGNRGIVKETHNLWRENPIYRFKWPSGTGIIGTFWRPQLIYTPDKIVDKREYRIEASGGQTTIEELGEELRKYEIDGNMRHVREEDKDRYVVRWYAYTPADDTVYPPGQLPNTSKFAIGVQGGGMTQGNNDLVDQMLTEEEKYLESWHLLEIKNLKD